MTAHIISWASDTATNLDALTTPNGQTRVILYDETDVRLRLYDGSTAGGVKMARLDEVTGGTVSIQYAAPTTGTTVTMTSGVQSLILNPAGTIATLTVTLPSSPANGAAVDIRSTQQVTAITVQGAGAETITGATGQLNANGRMTFLYRSSDTTWYGGH